MKIYMDNILIYGDYPYFDIYTLLLRINKNNYM